jgi:dimethylhistidine N-methyltransferase
MYNGSRMPVVDVTVPTPGRFGLQDVQTALLERFRAVRGRTLELIASLGVEDMAAQSMDVTSPGKWHLAHTTWFFETFVLVESHSGYSVFNPHFFQAFSPLYATSGSRWSTGARSVLTRPTLNEVLSYRRYVDSAMSEFLTQPLAKTCQRVVELGIAHEERHQELILMDLLHLFSLSPFDPVYDPNHSFVTPGRRGLFRAVEGGLVSIGFQGCAFAFTNESPRHRRWLEPFEISDRLVTCGEWIGFIDDGGYHRPELWLSDGWEMAQRLEWTAPFYWQRRGGHWWHRTLAGMKPVDVEAAVRHVSYFEADAFARWSGARLPTEAEWELAGAQSLLEQIADTAWQWTSSTCEPYPGHVASRGALGQYNGRCTSGQMVLRGGAGETPAGHARLTYRNSYRPEQRWMFAGLRLARSALTSSLEPIDESLAQFASDVVAGLSKVQKQLSPKYFYDGRGSALFERICLTKDYYPTRTEMALLTQVVATLSGSFPEGTVLIEYGSGASEKTRMLLDGVGGITTYVAVDVSRDALQQAAGSLREDYPHLAIHPVEGDFMQMENLPTQSPYPNLGFFPGSTIGNFERAEAVQFLVTSRRQLGHGATLLVGVDLLKEVATLQRAYDDDEGVTAEFNRNLLHRMNRELGGRFNPDHFDHVAVWNPAADRIEMHLRSAIRQEVQVAGHVFSFAQGETIHTENSHKFTVDSFSAMAADGGWRVGRVWTSDTHAFSMFELLSTDGRTAS